MDDIAKNIGGGAVAQPPGVAFRLRIVRRYAGAATQAEMAEILDCLETTWGNQESGTSELSKTIAFKIVEKFDELTLDWLWFGRDRGLSRQTVEDLTRISRELERQPRRGRRPR